MDETRVLGNPEIFYDIIYKWNVLSNYIKIRTQIGADDSSSSEIFWFRIQRKKRKKKNPFLSFETWNLKLSTHFLFKKETRAYKSWWHNHCWYFKHTIQYGRHIQIRIKGMQNREKERSWLTKGDREI